MTGSDLFKGMGSYTVFLQSLGTVGNFSSAEDEGDFDEYPLILRVLWG
jgi:hypothetical protein